MAGNLLTAKEAADYLRMNIGTFHNRRSKGTLKLPIIKLGASVRFTQQDLDAYITAHRIEAA